jgi:anion-transporting  ArsA/GET3 family ATPase
MKPRVFVCAGGGGVGKTTASAALALALAREGRAVLIVTVDPARRLAQAMGVEIGERATAANLEGGIKGRLFALMPEPKNATHTFARVVFRDDPAACARMFANRVYTTLGDAMAGIHELVSLMLLSDAVREREYDAVVVDTAPSRHALDFISYPGRLADMLEGRAMSWLGGMADRAAVDAEEPPSDEGGLIAWGKKRIEAAVGRVLNPRTLRELTDMFAELLRVRERFVTLARHSEELLLGPEARYLLVAAPTRAAQADLTFIAARLAEMGQRPHAFVLNRADTDLPEWAGTLSANREFPAAAREALGYIEAERRARQRAAERVELALGGSHPRVMRIRLPTVEAREPSTIVRALADELGPRLATL